MTRALVKVQPARKNAKERSTYLTIWPNFTTVRHRGELDQKVKSYLTKMCEKTVGINIWIKILCALRFGTQMIILRLDEQDSLYKTGCTGQSSHYDCLNLVPLMAPAEPAAQGHGQTERAGLGISLGTDLPAVASTMISL
jgi:hypothetical protein